ncbi:hypothetical protein HDV57DRAFT_491705 [Trichoderma longibrachiatum]|uniref:Uncharacterized protein n=1 Tax=Trichoderma longibrachiatum ATCC 18648 TaxID=983965 RepID=A0A2T4C292_TRILO|nr:hypothetical protein M440DRAFT_1259005 [Trichoderma longibrachiatum ATCC 18648]
MRSTQALSDPILLLLCTRNPLSVVLFLGRIVLTRVCRLRHGKNARVVSCTFPSKRSSASSWQWGALWICLLLYMQLSCATYRCRKLLGMKVPERVVSHCAVYKHEFDAGMFLAVPMKDMHKNKVARHP